METQKITNALLTLVAATLVIVISVSTVRAQESASGEDPASAQVTPLFFEDVRVFDGEQVIERADVVVEDGVITSVDEDLEAPESAEVIDGEGRTLLPGLIDAHFAPAPAGWRTPSSTPRPIRSSSTLPASTAPSSSPRSPYTSASARRAATAARWRTMSGSRRS